jgi:hypothetical protein
MSFDTNHDGVAQRSFLRRGPIWGCIICAFAAPLGMAQAATTAATGTLTAGGLSGGVQNLAVTIPGNAVPGAYSDTLTYTIAAGVGA